MIGAHKCRFFTSVLLLVGTPLATGSSDFAGCEADLSHTDIGLSLLQTGSKRTPAQSLDQPLEAPTPGIALKTLPGQLYTLGLKLFQKAEVLDAIVASTVLKTFEDAGETVKIRKAALDIVDDVEHYGLQDLESPWMVQQRAQHVPLVMNMVDIGGNLGRATLAAFRKYPTKMRIVVVEPVPETYFLLRWNLWLNDVPVLTLEEFRSYPTQAGVLALNNGIASTDNQEIGMCTVPPYSMNARICDCSAQELEDAQKADKDKSHCLPVIGRTIDYFLNLFGNKTIAFLKMDCEGCEYDAMPALAKHVEKTGQHIIRFAGELHEATNELEDIACRFEEGKWFVHVCHIQHHGFKNEKLIDRCHEGPGRVSCLSNKYLHPEDDKLRAGGDFSNLFESAGGRV